MRLLFVCLYFFVNMSAASAYEDNSAKKLHERCNFFAGKEIDFKKLNSHDQGYCMGMIVTILALGPTLIDEFKFCPTSNVPISAMGVFNKYLREHPDVANKNDLLVLDQAYREEWPCK